MNGDSTESGQDKRREELIRDILRVITNDSNLPTWMQLVALGRDMRPLAETIADGILEAPRCDQWCDPQTGKHSHD